MFKFYVMCDNSRLIDNLIHDYIRQYPEDVLTFSKRFKELSLIDGTLIQFISALQPEKCIGIHEDIYTEGGFREMYQVR